MNALVTRYLNVRTGGPEILPYNNPGFLPPNTTVKIVDTVLGQEYKGNSIWHKLADGSFVWSGAIDANVLEAKLDWWYTAYQIVEVWKILNTMGEGVKVAVVDSGIDLQHPFLDKNLVFGTNTHSPGKDFTDQFGHGTEVASVICGNRVNAFGTSPRCELFIIKATAGGTMTAGELMNGLRAIPEDVDIVNISQAITSTPTLNVDLRDYFQAHPQKVFVCGAGNNGLSSVTNNLPAAASKDFPNVISVAGVDKLAKASTYYSCKSDFLTLAAPSEGILTMNMFDRSKLYPAYGTSMAAPIVSGLLALGKSYLIKQRKFTNILTVVNALRDSLRPAPPQQKDLYGMGIIDPLNFSKELQTLNPTNS